MDGMRLDKSADPGDEDGAASARSLVISCVHTPAEAAAQIGQQAYSYYYVLEAFAPLLARWGKVRIIDRPESRLDHALTQACARGQDPLHLGLVPLHAFYPAKQAVNAAFPFWEFPDIPGADIDYNARNNWVRQAERLDLILTACTFTRDAFRRAGVKTPMHVVPVPVRPELFDVPGWRPDQRVVLDCPCYLFPEPNQPVGDFDPWVPVTARGLRGFIERARRAYKGNIRPRLPNYISFCLKKAHRLAKEVKRLFRRDKAPTPTATQLALEGVVYSTIVNPFDPRKNWRDLLSGFLLALGERADVTLVIKLVVGKELEATALKHVIGHYRRMGIHHRCKLAIVTAYLSDAQMIELARASTYYVTATHAEGACLPLQDMLAAGRPAVAPCHTALEDYFDEKCGFVVDSHAEPASWPHDSSGALRTTWQRIVWQSLHDQLCASYQAARDDIGLYRELADASRQRMLDHASPEAVWPRLSEALEALAARTSDAKREFTSQDSVLSTEYRVTEAAGSVPLHHEATTDASDSCFLNLSPLTLRSSPELPLYVEVSALLAPHLTGIGRFVARLVEALARHQPLRLLSTINGAHAENVELLTDLQCGEEIHVRARDLPVADTDLDAWVRRLLRRPKHAHDACLASRCAGVYTLLRPRERHFRQEIGLFYDFTPCVVPWAHTADTREHFGIFFTETSGLCDKMVAISASTKRDAGWLSAARQQDTVVCAPGPSLCVGQHAHPGPVERLGSVVLVVSTLEPRKNGRFLLDWFLGTSALRPDTELWWVGPHGWLHETGRSRRFGGRRPVKFLGMVSDRRLCELYRQSAFSIYPSLYEGFGFPILDSLRHGTPVACAYHSALAEFAGPGVHYFDACDAASLDDACRALSATTSLALKRYDLEERCTWDRLACEIIGLTQADSCWKTEEEVACNPT
jgi:glycosyltransferase involved in cell wall biosynthesis